VGRSLGQKTRGEQILDVEQADGTAAIVDDRELIDLPFAKDLCRWLSR